LAQTTTDRKAEAARLVQEGDRYYYQGQYQVTLEKYQQALAIYQQIADRQQEGVILNNIGFVYTELEKSKQALPFAEVQHLLSLLNYTVISIELTASF
jgi:tetratricopeptide (TPR) repeat protein